MRCNYCEWRCELDERRSGVCKMYVADQGTITERFPYRWSSCGTSRIESIPLYHVYPGSRSLAIGTAGCNFSCKYCSNAYIAKEDPALVQGVMTDYDPKQLITMARKLGESGTQCPTCHREIRLLVERGAPIRQGGIHEHSHR